MPKTTPTQGRSKQRRPQANRPESTVAEAMQEPQTAERDESPPSSTSSVDVVPETQQDPVDTQRQPSCEEEPSRQQKKRVRVSKKEIPEYQWKEEGERRLADLVKEHPQLYDKRQKEWLNVAAKNRHWNRVGEQLDPPASGPQCKKHYENMRTRLGKIVKKEKKSGAGQPDRSVRDEEILQTWGFLTQHIVRGETVPSEQFAVPESATVTTIDDDDDEVRSTGSHSLPSTSTGKGKGKSSKPPATKTATTTAVAATTSGVTQSDLSEAVSKILAKADSLGASQSYTGHQKIVHDFACLLEGHMQAIPEEAWHEFQIDCLNLVNRYRQRRQLLQQPQQQQPMTWQGPQQQQPWQPPQQQFWHPPQAATWQAPPQQQPQQQPPAGQPAPGPWLPPQSPQASQWEPGMPPAPSATRVQPESPLPTMSQSLTFKTPLTPSLNFPGLTPGSGDSSLEGISPSALFTSKDLNTPPVRSVSLGSSPNSNKDSQ